MKYAIIVILATIMYATCSCSKGGGSYKTFDKTLEIHLYWGGGMRYASENVYIRYDSCIRVDMEQGVDRVTKFAMTDELRKQVLDILDQCQPKSIQQSNKHYFAHDKATTRVEFKLNGKHDFSASSGSSTEIAEGSRENFRNLWDKLDAFSRKKK
ncbi:MAG TPA: hypothetical protein VK177_14130 [Flavobacteriales bacterium]|nr:hypothetical protein [Flavobacteriales bacterium]